MFGDDSEEVTPVPIPNTEVKLFSANGSWGFPPVRVGRRQAKDERLAEMLAFFMCARHGNYLGGESPLWGYTSTNH